KMRKPFAHSIYNRWARLALSCALVFGTIGSLVTVTSPASGAAVTVGFRDFSYTAASVSAPTAERPQNKLWFNDGVWWGCLFDRIHEEYHIYRLDWGTQTWIDTGTLIDERNTSHADTLWDGAHLYVATANPATGT